MKQVVILGSGFGALSTVRELPAARCPQSLGGITLTAFDPALAEQMEVAESIMREDRAVLRKLAQ